MRPGRWLLGLAALVLALGLAEAMGALVRGRPGCGGGAPPLWRPDRASGWALVPGARGEAVVCRGAEELARHTIVINALGQRDRPRRYERKPGTARVAVLGDSFVEAVQVELEETATARLEQSLGVEVLNLGVSGYSTDNELRAFAHRDWRYRPDAVVLLLHTGNDVLENGGRLYLANPHGLPPKPWLTARTPSNWLARCLAAHRLAARMAAGTPSLLWADSRLVRAGFTGGLGTVLRAACARDAAPAESAILGVYEPPATLAWAEAWATTERLLAHIATRVTRSGAVFGIALGPACLEYDPRMRWIVGMIPPARARALDYDYPHHRLGDFLTRNGVPWVSLLPTFRAYHAVTGRSGCYDWDAHWDAEGHRLAAGVLGEFVQRLLHGG